jgi:hypothetical protein
LNASWSPASIGDTKLPTEIPVGDKTVIVPLPKESTNLVLNGDGYTTDPIVLGPPPPPPPEPPLHGCETSRIWGIVGRVNRNGNGPTRIQINLRVGSISTTFIRRERGVPYTYGSDKIKDYKCENKLLTINTDSQCKYTGDIGTESIEGVQECPTKKGTLATQNFQLRFLKDQSAN